MKNKKELKVLCCKSCGCIFLNETSGGYKCRLSCEYIKNLKNCKMWEKTIAEESAKLKEMQREEEYD